MDVFIELPQTDAGSRCAGITAAAMALADAGIKMKDMVSAVAVGFVDDKVCIDLDYNEEAYDHIEGGVEGAPVSDIPVAMIPSTGEFTLLQMDGLTQKEHLIEALEKAGPACEKIKELQLQAIAKRYEAEK